MIDTPHLSLFHKILILIEDKGSATLTDLQRFGSTRQTLGALGRLEGLHYIERTKEENGEDYFTLTDQGDEVLAAILTQIPKSDRVWDKKWRLIIFDIPESHRTIRQMFRLKLLDLGARMLQSSVWITPSAVIAERFLDHIAHNEFASRVHVFEAVTVTDSPIDIAHLWDLSNLEAEYKALFTYFDKTYHELKKNPEDASFQAKCMIVLLAMVTKKDPQLPTDLMPKAWIGKNVQDWYQKLRAFCQ